MHAMVGPPRVRHPEVKLARDTLCPPTDTQCFAHALHHIGHVSLEAGARDQDGDAFALMLEKTTAAYL